MLEESIKLNNKYYICLKKKPEKMIQWNPFKSNNFIIPDCRYWSLVFQEMEKNLKINNLIFYLTFNLDKLPSYGSNVIAVVLGDEWCRIPDYSHKVRAIFKCYGIQPMLGCNPLKQPSYLSWLTLMHFLKICITRLPGLLNYNLQNFKFLLTNKKNYVHIYDVPLGFYKQLELPIKNLEERTYDVFFAGSIYQKQYSIRSLKYWLRDPKIISRKIMLKKLDEFKNKYPDIKIKTAITSGFHQTTDYDVISYSENMMNSKICLVPRGTSFETYRFFEALRYGCIVIAENLPNRWFYQDCSYIKISDWKDLENILLNLTSCSKIWTKKHQESLRWWQEQCSEQAVGKYIAEKINNIFFVQKANK